MRLTPAVASVLPSGEKAIPNIATGSSSIRPSNSPLRVFQARRLVSQLPAARIEPSGENASEEVPPIPEGASKRSVPVIFFLVVNWRVSQKAHLTKL